MAHKIRVRELVAQSGLGLDLVLLLLQENGFSVRSIEDHVPKGRMSEALRLLEIPSRPKRNTVDRLAADFQMEPSTVRSILRKRGILGKSSQSKFQYSDLPRAEVALRKAKNRALGLPDVETPSAVATTVASTTGPLQRPRHRTRSPEWYTIGRIERVLHTVTPEDVELVHWRLVTDFKNSRDPIDPAGVKSHQLLGSAVHRPHTAIAGERKYPTVSMAAAALLHSLVHNHPFHNGNKRTALVAMLVFLDKNGHVLIATQDEVFDFVLRLGGHTLLEESDDSTGGERAEREVLAVAQWIQRHMRRTQVGEKPLKFRELRAILLKYGCEVQPVPGNRVWIRRGLRKTQVAYGGDGREVKQNSVHKIRRDLGLDAEHGFDQDIFYNAGKRLSDFINKYRQSLDRLATM